MLRVYWYVHKRTKGCAAFCPKENSDECNKTRQSSSVLLLVCFCYCNPTYLCYVNLPDGLGLNRVVFYVIADICQAQAADGKSGMCDQVIRESLLITYVGNFVNSFDRFACCASLEIH